MRIGYLKFLDRHAGRVLNACLILFRPLITPRKAKAGAPEKILIIKFWGLGSIVCAYDFFLELRRRFPDAQICALTLKQNSEIFKISGIFDQIVALELKSAFKFSFDALKAANRLRKQSFDLSFDLEFTSRFSAIVSSIIRAGKSVGFKYAGIDRGGSYTHIVYFREDQKLKTSIGKMLDLLGEEKPGSGQLELKIDKEESRMLEQMLESGGLKTAVLVGMNINASELCLLRRWPLDYFIKLSRELLNKYPVHIVFTGSKDDKEYVRSAIGRFSQAERLRVHDFSGRFSLVQLACLIKKMKLFISNDSGPLHLAAYLKVPTISFFGPETPLIYGPDGPSDTVLYRAHGCSPCIRVQNYKSSKCADNRCLKEIKPEDVLDEIKRKKIL